MAEIGSAIEKTAGLGANEFSKDNTGTAKKQEPPLPEIISNLHEASVTDSIFHVYKPLYSFDPHINGYVALFFTTPMMNLDEANLTAMDMSAAGIGTDVLNSLSYLGSGGSYGTASKFCKPLCNMAISGQLDDISTNDTSGWDNLTGWAFHYGGRISNENGREFSIKFEEKNNLLITRMMTFWTRYMSLSKYGMVLRTEKNVNARRIDYMSSLYTFILEPDATTVRYWAKDTGIYPKGVPLSSLGLDKESHDVLHDVTVPFKSNLFEAMTDSIILDFQSLTNGGEDPIAYEPFSKEFYKGYTAPGIAASVDPKTGKTKLKLVYSKG